MRRRGTTRGFTLIELMIVVAILGILAVIGIPNFLRFQGRAKQAEARANLGAIHVAQASYFSEVSLYGETFDLINWGPMGQNRYAYGMGASTIANVRPALPAYAATVATFGGCDDIPNDNGFSACAEGNIDENLADSDRWRINDDKILTNVSSDLL